MSEKTSFFQAIKKTLIVLLVLGVIAFGVSWAYLDQFPTPVYKLLVKAKSAAFEDGPIAEYVVSKLSIPEKVQIPLISALGIVALGLLLYALRFTAQNPKLVTAMAILAAGAFAYATYFGVAPSYPEIDKKLVALPKLKQEKPSPETKVGNPTEETTSDSIVQTQKYKVAAEYNELLVMDPSTDVIYPGALIKGETIGTGEYTPIVVDRQPITISASLENIEGNISRKIENPKLSTVREAVKEILNQKVTGATPARVTFKVHEVHSSEQLKLAIGANYSYSGGFSADIKGSFNFNTSENKSRYLVKFMQAYYSLDMDSPKNPTEVFANPKELNFTMLGSVSPMYVSSVTYGRMAMFSVESSASKMELKAALDAAFEAGAHSGGVQIDSSYETTLSESTITGTIIGGSGQDAANTVSGLSGMMAYISKGGNWGPDSPASPLSYKLRYLSDNSVGNVVMATEYTVRNVTKITSQEKKFKVTLVQLVCNESDDEGPANTIEVYGKISVKGKQFEGNKTPVDIAGGTLWEISAANSGRSLSMYTGDKTSMGREKILTFNNADLNRSYIEISGNMTEWDEGAAVDDPMGSDSKKVFLSRPSGATLSFIGSDGNVSAILAITPLQ